MGTEITTSETRLAKAGIVSLTKSLSPPALDHHRAALGIELEVVSVKADRFGWDRMSNDLRLRLRQDWMDALQDFTLDEVRAACREALGGNARDAVNEEKIKALIIADRARRLAAIPKPLLPEPESKRPDAETRALLANELLAGFNSKRMDAAQ